MQRRDAPQADGSRWHLTMGPVLGAVMLALGCASASAQPVAEPVEKGRALAERMCAVCHLNPGQGEKAGPGTVPGFVAVAKRPGQTLEGIVAWLRSVPVMMPDHHLSQDEMEALAIYILSLADGSPGGAAQ